MTVFNVILIFALIFICGYSMITKYPDDINKNEEETKDGEEK